MTLLNICEGKHHQVGFLLGIHAIHHRHCDDLQRIQHFKQKRQKLGVFGVILSDIINCKRAADTFSMTPCGKGSLHIYHIIDPVLFHAIFGNTVLNMLYFEFTSQSSLTCNKTSSIICFSHR